MARKRTGSLVQRRNGEWFARIPVTGPDGIITKKLVELGTKKRPVTNKSVAKRLLANLMAKGTLDADELEAEAPRYTVDDFAKEHYEQRDKAGVKSWKDERQLYLDCLAPHIGTLPLDDVTPKDVLDCLDTAAGKRAHESVKKIRTQVFGIFRAARMARLTTNDPLEGLKTPHPRKLKLHRAILTEDEFTRYVEFPHGLGFKLPPGTIDFELKVMSIVARTIGGQRGSDVHALEWQAVDCVDFAKMMVRRPKTEHLSDTLEETEYEIPEMARPYLRLWWESQGWASQDKPASGPVFPVRRGDRAGKARGKATHAAALRRDLARAFGIERPVTTEIVRKNGRKCKIHGWEKAREMTPRETELLLGTDRLRPVDFHSFRRAFATGLRRAKVDARDAMRLSAHTSFETHQRYVQEDGPILAPPAAALPLLPPARPVLRTPRRSKASDRNPVQSGESQEFSLMISSGWPDLNRQRPAPKAADEHESLGKNVDSARGNEESGSRFYPGSGAIGQRSLSDRMIVGTVSARWELMLDAVLRLRADEIAEGMRAR